jgi:hypothetical protein
MTSRIAYLVLFTLIWTGSILYLLLAPPTANSQLHIRSRVSEETTVGSMKKPLLMRSFVSRHSSVTLEASVRGNLGPISVITQEPPGNDWIKSRWQAASDMGGTAIKGSHWVVMHFNNQIGPVIAESIIIDWETAYADDYLIQVPDSNSNANSNANGIDWRTIFDGSDPAHAGRRSSISSGKSPGRGAEAFPLHIVHTIDLTGDDGNGVEMSHMRLFIRKGAKPWGVSIWQLDVKGYSATDTDEV